MTRVSVAMIGARMHYAVPRLLADLGLLDRFFTDAYLGNKPWLRAALASLPPAVRAGGIERWLGRRDDALPADRVVSFDWLGLWYVHARHRARTPSAMVAAHESMASRFGAAAIGAGVTRAASVWCYNTAALEIFVAAKAAGKTCILEQTILPRVLEDRLMAEAEARLPGWAGPEALRPAVGQHRREAREWELADRIVAGSEFVAAGLEACGVPRSKVTVIPYGVDAERFRPSPPARRDGPLRVLFVGEVGLRKGAPYLIEAARALGPERIQVRFVGRVTLNRAGLDGSDRNIEFAGVVPRSRMPAEYRWADLFVLPSFVEGSATASYEALLSGLPVIVTPNAGAPVVHGVHGTVVPTGDPDALREAMLAYVASPELRLRHAANVADLRPTLGLDRYRADLLDLVMAVDRA